MSDFKFYIKNNRLALLFIFAYLVLLAPYALNFIFYLPDEHHYVDAAIYMLKHGGYLSPHDPDGGYRFLKPIFTYWVVLGSYKIFGISEFSSRLPILLTAGMVLWMTYRITLLAFKQKDTALLAMLIAGATPVLNRSASITITDLFLLFFLQVMVWGVVGLLVSEKREKRFLWAMYIGAGLATMSKGLPAVAFLFLALFFLLVNPWKRFRLLDILYLPSIVVGIFLGGFWYVAVIIEHGPDALASFFEDQVGMRLAEKLQSIVFNFFFAVVIILFILFPMALPGWRSLFYRNKELRENTVIKSIVGFTVLWVVAMIGMASLVTKLYYRYLLPVIPLMAMTMAYFIQTNRNEKGTVRFTKAASIIAYSLFTLVNVTGLVSNYIFKGPVWYYFILMMNIGVASWFFFKLRQATVFRQTALVFVLMAGLFWGLYFVISPISMPGTGVQLADKLDELGIDSTHNIRFYGKKRSSSRLRLATKGEYALKAYLPHELPIQPEDEILIVSDSFLDSLSLDGFQLHIGSAVWNDIKVDEILKTKSEEELHELKLKRAHIHYICIRE